MLVLSRKVGEEIVIDGCIKVRIVSINSRQVRIGIEAPSDVPVHRQDVYQRIMGFAEPEFATADGR